MFTHVGITNTLLFVKDPPQKYAQICDILLNAEKFENLSFIVAFSCPFGMANVITADYSISQ